MSGGWLRGFLRVLCQDEITEKFGKAGSDGGEGVRVWDQEIMIPWHIEFMSPSFAL